MSLARSGRFHWFSLALLLFALPPWLAAQNMEPQVLKTGEPRVDKPRDRDRYFFEQRAFPLGFIPPGARLEALKRLEQMRVAEGRTREGRGKMEASTASGSQPITASTTVWTNIGPRPNSAGGSVGSVAGRTAAVATNPLNHDEVYVGGAQGGVWRSTNGGLNWTPLTDFEASLAIGSIAVDGSTCSASMSPVCQTIYVATGEQTFSGSSYYGAGILKTTNGGANWTQLTGVPAGGGTPFFVGPFSSATGGSRFSAIAIQPGTGGATAVLLAGVQVFTGASATGSGVYRSTDAGATWTQVLSGAVGTEVAFDRANPNIAWAALGTTSISAGGPTADPENGIYKSTNGGANFVSVTANLPLPVVQNSNIGRVELSVGPPVPPSSEGVVYASIANATTSSNNLLGVFKTVNGGNTWTHLAAAPAHCDPQCWYDHVIGVHPNDANVVYMGGSATSPFFARTNDGGASWQSASSSFGGGSTMHVDIQSMGFGFTAGNASRLFVGNDGGLWRADITNPQLNAGLTSPLTWVNLNGDLAMIQFYPSPSIHPTNPDIGFGGTQDNGTQRYSGVLQWNSVTCGDGAWTAINPQDPNFVFSNCQNIDIRRSTNGGTSGFAQIDNPASNPINQSDRVAFIPPLVLDMLTPTRLYFGTCRVWLSTDATATTPSWTAISPDLTGGGSGAACPTTAAGTIRTIAVSPNNSSVVYVGTSDGRVQMTSNATAGAGATWTNVTGTGLPVRLITWVAVHPTNPNIVFAAASGFTFGSDTRGHVFRTDVSVNPITWTDISTNLPNTPANVIVVDAENPNQVFVGTDIGVFASLDAQAATPNWSTLVTGLPRVAVLGMTLHVPSRTLRAATHGRGMWDLIVPSSPGFAITAITPSSAAAGAAGFTLTVDGIGFTPNSVVRWAGGNRTTQFVGATQLTATIPAGDIAVAGNFAITVTDPGQANPTNSRTFTVIPPPFNITLLTPQTAVVNSGAFSLQVDGVGFTSNSVVRWASSNRVTTFVSPTRLNAAITAADVSVIGNFAITVTDPGQPSPSNSLNFSVTAVPGQPPPNDNVANAITVNAATFTNTVDSTNATVEGTDVVPPCTVPQFPPVDNGRAKSVWYKFTPSANGTATITTVGSLHDTILTVVTGTPGSFAIFACDDDSGGSLTSSVNIAVVANTTYHFQISSYDGTGGTTVFNVNSTVPPVAENRRRGQVISNP
jgi:hypothetical protein